jgi:4'-phosphopantetheinyl transferase
LGRWTAKLLLQACLTEAFGRQAPLAELVIGRETSGAPVALLEQRQASRFGLPDEAIEDMPLVGGSARRPEEAALVVRGVRLPVSLSISHSGELAFCAAALRDAPGQRWNWPWPETNWIGVDVERVERRSKQFQHDYFSHAERSWLATAAPEQRERLSTATWSAKESVLKALRLGLTVDTRRVSALCRLGDPGDWLPVDVDYDPALASLASLAAHGRSAGLANVTQRAPQAWWRSAGDYVLTVVLFAEGEGKLHPIRPIG